MMSTQTETTDHLKCWGEQEVEIPGSFRVYGTDNIRVSYYKPGAGESEKHDVRLDCGNAQFWAHRSALSAASGFFHGMFSNSYWLESREFAVEINQEPKVLRAVLEWIYTGTYESAVAGFDASIQCDERVPFFYGLFDFLVHALAEEYQIDELKNLAARRVDDALWGCPKNRLHYLVRLVYNNTLPLPRDDGEPTLRKMVATYVAETDGINGQRLRWPGLAKLAESSKEFSSDLAKASEAKNAW